MDSSASDARDQSGTFPSGRTIVGLALVSALCHGCNGDAGSPDSAPPADAAASSDASQGPTDHRPPDDIPIAPGAVDGECDVPATYATIQSAVDDGSCTLILVASGTYIENLAISRSLEIRGPAPPSEPAVIDGGGATTVITTMSSTVVELNHLTIQNGLGTDFVGAGIHTSGELRLHNSSVVMNAGRGIFKKPVGFGHEFELRVVDSVIAYNTSIGIWGDSAGTIHVQGSELHNNGAGLGASDESIYITDGSVIRDNGGTALFSWETVEGFDRELVIADSVIDGNGLGIRIVGPAVSIDRTRIVNTAFGPGVRLEHGDLGTGAPWVVRITDSAVVGNDGGVAIIMSELAWCVEGPQIRIERSLIANNAGDGNGKGVSLTGEPCEPGVLEIVNTTISGNARGLYVTEPWDVPRDLVFLSNVTITNNHAASGIGGGIYARGERPEPPLVSDGPQLVLLHNSIVAGNTASGVPDDCATVDDAHVETNGYNVLGAVDGCEFTGIAGDLLGADPLLGPLADNGGPTLTHALLSGSPARDAGSPTGCSDAGGMLLVVDQRGQPRPVGPACDSGAYEAGP